MLAIAVALPLVGLVGYGVWRLFEADRTRAMHDLEFLQEVNVQSARNFIEQTRHKLERIAQHPRVQTMQAGEIAAFLRDVAETNPDLANIRVLGPGGELVASASPVPPEVEAALLTSPAYLGARAAPKFTISEPYQGISSARWTCLASHPVVDADGRRLGTIVAPLRLQEIAGLLNLPASGSGLVVGMISHEGVIVLRLPEPDHYVGRRADQIAEVHARLDRGENKIETPGFDGLTRTALFSRVGTAPWIVVTSMPTESILRGAKRNLWQALAACAIVFALGAYLVSRYARTIEAPIMALAHAARDQAAGQTERLAPVTGPAEVAETARAFNEMLAARRQAQILLAQSEQRYRTVIDQTGQMVYDLDLTTNFIQWFGTEATPAITGYSLAEFQSVDLKRWEEMIHPDDRARAVELLDRAVEQRTRYQVEYRFRRKDGGYCHIEDHGIFLFAKDGKPERLLGRMSDISVRRQVEEERQQIGRKLQETQKLESLGVLAGGIAHDFNNLLTGILGNAGLARLESPRGWNGTEHLAQIEKAALRAADLCKQMLAYSGKGRFVVQRLSINELIEDTAQLLQISISKKATLHLQLGTGLPAISADATQLRQVVMNLVINASEALGDRTGQITISTGRVLATPAYLSTVQFQTEIAPGDYVFVEVSDTGSGMSRETLARIFDPFFTTKFTGRGLGLAAVLGIVRGHKGAIKVYSEPGRGTTFRILLPPAEGAPQPLNRPAAAVPEWRGSGHVLVIDDEESVRTVARSVLEFTGFSVEEAGDGAAGVEIFTRDPNRFTAVLLDLTMPQMDGEEAFRQLRLLNPEVRVVLMSGFNRVDAINRFVGKGLAGFVQKPFEVQTLVNELRRVLERAAGGAA
jgi:PAS domain S-box-containing protein